MTRVIRTAWRNRSLRAMPVIVTLVALTAVAVEPPAHLPPRPEVRPPSLLLMVNGKVVEGQITPCAGGYMVEMSNGKMLVPQEQVQFDAADFHDAYRKLRLSMPSRTVDRHVALARWCVTNDLHDLAEGELRDALELDPRSESARSMLVRLDELRRQPAASDEEETPSRRGADGFEVPESRALSGLPREAATEFISRVQPILLNSCGNASCHSSSSHQKFRLLHVRAGRNTHRVFAERNLAQVLKQIDFADPERSPLLTIPDDTHGRAGRPVFGGTVGNEQRETLRAWIRAVARDPAAAVSASVNVIEAESSVIRPVPAAAVPSPVTPIVIPVGGQTDAPLAERPHDVVEQVLREERNDAFDPEVFNRASRRNAP